jgi:hypothetical protein
MIIAIIAGVKYLQDTRYLWMGNMFFVTSDVLGYITITQK